MERRLFNMLGHMNSSAKPLQFSAAAYLYYACFFFALCLSIYVANVVER